MIAWAIASGAAIGLVHGARHALEPDHLAAVSTMVSDQPGARSGARLGAIWGVGHTVTLVGVAIALTATGAALPATAERGFDLVVAMALTGLGVRSVMRARRARTAHPHPVRTPRGALGFGMLHGLAGSGAITALTVAELPTAIARLAFVGVFGAGSVVGMAALSGALGAPLARATRVPAIDRSLRVVMGAMAIAVGAFTAAVAVGAVS